MVLVNQILAMTKGKMIKGPQFAHLLLDFGSINNGMFIVKFQTQESLNSHWLILFTI